MVVVVVVVVVVVAVAAAAAAAVAVAVAAAAVALTVAVAAAAFRRTNVNQVCCTTFVIADEKGDSVAQNSPTMHLSPTLTQSSSVLNVKMAYNYYFSRFFVLICSVTHLSKFNLILFFRFAE